MLLYVNSHLGERPSSRKTCWVFPYRNIYLWFCLTSTLIVGLKTFVNLRCLLFSLGIPGFCGRWQSYLSSSGSNTFLGDSFFTWLLWRTLKVDGCTQSRWNIIPLILWKIFNSDFEQSNPVLVVVRSLLSILRRIFIVPLLRAAALCRLPEYIIEWTL